MQTQTTFELVKPVVGGYCHRTKGTDCKQCKARQSAVVKEKRDKQQKDKRLILTMEDLSKALREVSTLSG
ncbi:hypothetical protein CK203_027414 [Vitis vinifera]|uniref:Uncharacterized protein n=1 Tax=Vitis vinifera TaxID=29760 RepID=A0A438JA27_VITVI|nr:hypothetical protein CK203_027414 [Vitis vinifera]